MSACIACDYRVSTEYFGHRIMPFVLRRLFDRPVALAPNGTPAVFGTGSNLSAASDGAIVCGAGFREASSKVPDQLSSARLLGLRGSLSAEMVAEASGIAPDSIPLGNAWEFLSEILGTPPAAPKYEFGVLAHPRDLAHAFVTSCQAAGGRFISPFDAIEMIVESLLECRAILTTSPEGLMLSDACQIPSRWIRIERSRDIPDFPIHDYLSGREGEPEAPARVHHFWDYGELVAECRVREPRRDRPKLSLESLAACQDEWPIRECPVHFSDRGERRRQPIPVFVISFNRLKCLRRLVDSLGKSDQPIEVVIHDNGSDYLPLLDYLAELEGQGTLVTRNPRLPDNPEGLEQVNETIDRYFQDFSEPLPFAVTDPDISFENSHPAFLKLYRDLLDRFPGVQCVGPQLPIHDIPDSLPLRDWVVRRQQHYWTRPPDQYLRWREDHDVHLRTNTVIDTTFALFRAGTRFGRLAKAIRVYAPFDARHLDWYQTETDDEMRHYQETASRISHWQGEYSREDRYRDFRLGPTPIFVTEPENALTGDWQIKRIEI